MIVCGGLFLFLWFFFFFLVCRIVFLVLHIDRWLIQDMAKLMLQVIVKFKEMNSALSKLECQYRVIFHFCSYNLFPS